MERWKPIEGLQDFYAVSNYGRVKSLARKQFNGKGFFTRKEQNLKPGRIGAGYLQVHLAKQGKVKDMLVARLVATAFIPNPENKPEVNHKDGDKTNCRVSNLEWSTHTENIRHAFAHGLIGPRNGSAGSGARLTERKVLEIRNRIRRGETQTAIAKEFKVGWRCIHSIAKRQTWSHI